MGFPIRRISILLLLCWTFVGKLYAQEVLTTDAGLPSFPRPSVERRAPMGNTARMDTLNLPFFDDFSSAWVTPDTSHWLMHRLDVARPSISIAKGHNVPSRGVLTFDGANIDGQKYDATFGAGLRDTLASQAIDLSTFSLNDSLALSFYVQLGGAGEAPDTDDSLVVLFDTTGDFEYMPVWAIRGTGSAESTFRWYYIPLDTSVFFHDAFRFKFESYGSLNGELDQFHVDYVLLDAQRQVSASKPVDISPTRYVQTPFYPYTAVPRKQARRLGAATTATRTLVSNAGDGAAPVSLSLSIDDPIGGNVFSGTTIVSASLASLPGPGHDTVNAAAFTSQSANYIAYGGVRVQAIKTAAGDVFPQNDTLRTTFRVDSILALDDGVGDFGYGLTNPRAFCQEFHIDQPDTMVAVWIHFAPSIHYNQANNISTDLLNKGFRLVVWDSLSVDSSLVETSGGMNVAYGNDVNQFIRFPLITETVVPSTFYVGLRQVDGMAIGVGFDRNESERRIYFENSVAEFQLSTNRGALMIRPEFRVPNLFVSAPEPTPNTGLSFQVAPHPVQNGQIGIRMEQAGRLKSVSFELLDLMGRRLQTWESIQPNAQIDLDLGQAAAAGYYLLQVRGIDLHGNVKLNSKKILIQNP